MKKNDRDSEWLCYEMEIIDTAARAEKWNFDSVRSLEQRQGKLSLARSVPLAVLSCLVCRGGDRGEQRHPVTPNISKGLRPRWDKDEFTCGCGRAGHKPGRGEGRGGGRGRTKERKPTKVDPSGPATLRSLYKRVRTVSKQRYRVEGRKFLGKTEDSPLPPSRSK